MATYARRSKSTAQVNVSRYGVEPWRRLSPFARHRVPVPGRFGYLDLLDFMLDEHWADSVEGLWQGLKIIDGATEPRLLQGTARKRRGRPSGHDFGYRALAYTEAKALIYVPSYLHVLRAESALLEQLGDAEIADVSYQPDTLGDKPISHAALLVDYLDGKLAPYEAAHQRCCEMAQRMLDSYENSAVVETGLREMNARVHGLDPGPLVTYESWATLFEREALMLSIVCTTGSHIEMEIVEPMIQSWLRIGLLTVDTARKLSLLAPVCRFSEDWLRLT